MQEPLHRSRHEAVALAAALLVFGGLEPARAQPPPPLVVTGMVHIDPIATAVSDSTIAIGSYQEHREGLLWYRDFADSTGLRISAQTGGLYAEACIRQGDWADFLNFMPGGDHHLGTHLHSHLKHPNPYAWLSLNLPDWSDPDSVRVSHFDQIPWINQIWQRNGFPITANRFYHGTTVVYAGMDSLLWCPPTSEMPPYPNCFDMAEGQRGQYWLYRGPFTGEPADEPNGTYMKLSSVGGIIGHDQVHGPEGMVYGTVPYQKRDFLRAYLEWREMVRRGERSAVRLFSWMVHPYQLQADDTGTDGVLIRDSIAELVGWLNDEWIGQTDESGFVMAEYRNADEFRIELEAWETAYPAEAETLRVSLERGEQPVHLPAVIARLDSCFYEDRETYPTAGVTMHEFTDHATDATLYAAWSTDGSTHTLHADYAGIYRSLGGDGTVVLGPWSDMEIGPEPVLLELITVTGAAVPPVANGGALRVQSRPNPFRLRTEFRFTLRQDAPVTLDVYDVGGRRLVRLLDERQTAGTHRLEWDGLDGRGRPVPPGVYLFRFASGTDRAAGKLVRID